jgi:hypothetical protein
LVRLSCLVSAFTLALTGATSAHGPRSLVKAFHCIYRHENGGQGWTARSNSNPTYYGGLQMDLDFQRTWGKEFLRAWGTADHWPKEVQIAVAIRAYFHRGFQPWPTTSRLCGLR